MDQRGEDRFRVILRRSAHPRSLTFTIHSRVHTPVRVHRHSWSDRSETQRPCALGSSWMRMELCLLSAADRDAAWILAGPAGGCCGELRP